MSHKSACLRLEDEHTEPYECDSDDSKYRHICCTRSEIVEPSFNTYGDCYKVEGYGYDDDNDDEIGDYQLRPHHHDD